MIFREYKDDFKDHKPMALLSLRPATNKTMTANKLKARLIKTTWHAVVTFRNEAPVK